MSAVMSDTSRKKHKQDLELHSSLETDMRLSNLTGIFLAFLVLLVLLMQVYISLFDMVLQHEDIQLDEYLLKSMSKFYPEEESEKFRLFQMKEMDTKDTADYYEAAHGSRQNEDEDYTTLGFGSHDFRHPLVADIVELTRRHLDGQEVNVLAINEEHKHKIISLKNQCHKKELHTLVIINSKNENSLSRQVIRQTWGNFNCWNKPVLFLFIVGTLTPYLIVRDGTRFLDYKNYSSDMTREADIYQDMIVAELLEHDFNDTAKMMLALDWAKNHCSHAKFILLTDDKHYINPYQVIRYLNSIGQHVHNRFIGGHVWRHSFPRRPLKSIPMIQSKWEVSIEEYQWEIYPPLISSGFVLMSISVLKQVATAMRYTRYFRIDDVFLGLVMHKLLVSPLHINNIVPHGNFTLASSKIFDFHIAAGDHDTPSKLQATWNRLHLDNLCIVTL